MKEFRSWTHWSYAMVEAGVLTLAEVNERLALELFIQNCYGITGTI